MKELAKLLFKYRSYTPLPMVIAMLLFFNGNLVSWIVGGITLLTGEIIRIWGVAYAGSLTRTTTKVKANYLVKNGPFSYVRNPLYLGNILIYMGFGIISLALFPYLQIGALIWFVVQYILIVKLEEEFLESKFGHEYIEYKKEVPRFFPNLFNKKFENNQVKPQLNKALKSEMRTIQALVSVSIISLIIHLVK